MSKRFLLILLGLAVLFIGIVVVTKNKADEPTTNGVGTSHTYGTGSVSFIEFGDFQCPACSAYYPIISELKEVYKDKITFQFRHYPLVNIHQNAMAAHRAAEAAGNQGKFWEMHNLLYERQKVWESANNVSQIFEDYATEIGVNVETFKKDVASSAVNDLINSDVKAAQAVGATGTPAFVLEGERLEDAPKDLEGFKLLIDEAIAKKQ